MTEGLILALIFSGIIALVGWKKQSLPIMFVSSLGWLVCALQTWQQTQEVLPMLLLFMLSAAQFIIINKEAA